MRKKISFIEVIIVIVVIVVVVKGYQFWNKPEEVPEVVPVPTEVCIANTPPTSPHIIPEMILIEGGTFQMGEKGGRDYVDKYVYPVEVSSFYMSKYEVTNAEYVKFLNIVGNQYDPTYTCRTWIKMNGDSKMGIEFITIPSNSNAPNIGNFRVKSGFENHPVVNVSWYGATAYCNWLSKQEGFTPVYGADPNSEDPDIWITKDGYRLPTEAEWEYACRAGTTTNYYWGDEMNEEYCWYNENSGDIYQPVGQKKPNQFGLYDMSGNVLEWCSDRHDLYYYHYGFVKNNIVSNPTGSNNSDSPRILRGGNWDISADFCQSAVRFNYYANSTSLKAGFRPVRHAP